MVLIFEKRMSLTDTKHRLSVPVNAFREHFPPIFHGNTVNIRIRNNGGNEEYELPCYKRPANHPSEKPVIGGHWRRIASANGYMEGDVIRFYKEIDNYGRIFFRFEVYRIGTNYETGEQVEVPLP